MPLEMFLFLECYHPDEVLPADCRFKLHPAPCEDVLELRPIRAAKLSSRPCERGDTPPGPAQISLKVSFHPGLPNIIYHWIEIRYYETNLLDECFGEHEEAACHWGTQ